MSANRPAHSRGSNAMSNPGAYEFFQKLESFLNEKIPSPGYMRDEVTRIVAESKGNEDIHMRFAESLIVIFPDLISTAPSSLKSDNVLITDSGAVPTILAKSSLETKKGCPLS